MTKEKMIQTAVDHVAYLRELESLNNWIVEVTDYKILDTHVGSGSSRIAAYNLGFDYVGFEIDEGYFKAQEERFRNHTAQLRLF